MELNTRRFITEMSVIGVTLALGAYTQLINWNPAVRTVAHFCGAIAVPGFASMLASNLIGSYEEYKTKKLQKSAKNDKENENLEYHVKPKTKDILLKTSAVLGSVAYIAFCASWESFQFSQSHNLELAQYTADTLGPIVGMASIKTIDGSRILNKFNKKVDSFKNKNKEKNREQNEKVQQYVDISKEKFEKLVDPKSYQPIEETNINYQEEHVTSKELEDTDREF